MELNILFENDYLPVLKHIINKATRSIYMSIYVAKIFKNRKQDDIKLLFDDLIIAAKNNIDVKILFNSILNNSLVSRANKNTFFYLKNTNIQLKYTPDSRTTHCKIIIIDDNISILGSHNLSNTSLHKNREVSILIKDELTNKILKEYFLKNFREARE